MYDIWINIYLNACICVTQRTGMLTHHLIGKDKDGNTGKSSLAQKLVQFSSSLIQSLAISTVDDVDLLCVGCAYVNVFTRDIYVCM